MADALRKNRSEAASGAWLLSVPAVATMSLGWLVWVTGHASADAEPVLGSGTPWMLLSLAMVPVVLTASAGVVAHSRRRATQLQAANAGLAGDVEQRTATERKLREQGRDLARLTEALQAAVAAAERASVTKSDFIATVSHELRTPLSGIMGLTELVKGTALTPLQTEYLSGVQGSAQLLLGLVNDLLDFSKIEAGRLTLERTAFDPRALIYEVGRLHAPEASRKGLSFFCEVDPAVGRRLEGDPLRVRQVVHNLLGNAVKFTSRGTVSLNMGLAAGGSHVVIVVRDTGVGIDAETRARLFTPFTQADTSTARRYGGSGLGLSISRRLAQLMGGDISVSSAMGEGATFIASLVLPQTSAPSSASLRAVVEPAAATDRRLLVVDDNPVNRLVAQHMLRRLGAVPVTAGDGAEALELLRKDPSIELVLMDCHMPLMDGFEATRKIRAGEAGDGVRQIPVLALTASAMQADRELCRAAGMDDFLPKPLTLLSLSTALEHWLPHHPIANEAQGLRATVA